MITKQKFNFDTQYYQFYIEDGSDKNKGPSSSPFFWDEKALNERLALTNGVIGVKTESYGNIKGEIEILNHENTDLNLDNYDHVVEAGIHIQSDKLQILDSPNSHIEVSIKIIPGIYRVRIYSYNLNSVIDDDGNDYYRIEIWPSKETERKVLKQYIH